MFKALASGRNSLTEVGSSGRHGAAVLAGFLGWMLDAFDFFLVVFCLTAIAKEFHQSDSALALSLSLTLAFRPVGAFIFGMLADRFGRRGPLMLALVFYSIIELLSGLAPNYTCFLVLRALFGVGMGGEWGVGTSLAMEAAPKKRRGFLSGVLQQGYAAGYLWLRSATLPSFLDSVGAPCSISAACRLYLRCLFVFA